MLFKKEMFNLEALTDQPLMKKIKPNNIHIICKYIE